MDTVVNWPHWITYLIYGTPVVATLITLVSNKALWVKAVSIAFVCVICGVMAATMLRPLRFGCDASGIRDQTFGSLVTIPWTDVTEARLVRGFYRTSYAPVRRTAGTAFDEVRSGYFRLADGSSARIFVQGGSGDALWLRTPGQDYLYAPNEIDALVSTAHGGLSVPIRE